MNPANWLEILPISKDRGVMSVTLNAVSRGGSAAGPLENLRRAIDNSSPRRAATRPLRRVGNICDRIEPHPLAPKRLELAEYSPLLGPPE